MAFDLWHTLDVLPGIVVGLTVHEAAHAWTASMAGDKTAEAEGRISLDPLKHIDLLGFAMILFAGFGWAKPVSFREDRMKNPRLGPMIVAVAGPLSNALLALTLSFAYSVVAPGLKAGGSTSHSLEQMLILAIYTNWGLFVFNMLPIPPLDGSHLLFGWLRGSNPDLYAEIYRNGTWLLTILLVVTSRMENGVPFLSEAVSFLSRSGLGLFSG